MANEPVRGLSRPRSRAVETEALLARPDARSLDPVDQVAADDRPVLEAVAGAAADDPDVVEVGMAVDEELAVRRRLVLADARLDDRRVGQVREAQGHVGPHDLDALGVDDPLAVGRVERRAVAVRPDLHPATVDRREAIDRPVGVEPAGE